MRAYIVLGPLDLLPDLLVGGGERESHGAGVADVADGRSTGSSTRDDETGTCPWSGMEVLYRGDVVGCKLFK